MEKDELGEHGANEQSQYYFAKDKKNGLKIKLTQMWRSHKRIFIAAFAVLGCTLFILAITHKLWMPASRSSKEKNQEVPVKEDQKEIGKQLPVNEIGKQPPVNGSFPQMTNFLVIGDYGTGNSTQYEVADTLKKFATTLNPKPSFVLSTGDQIYHTGIKSADDPVLVTRFEKMYEHKDLQVPWYITIGNHDCEGSIDAMLEYAKKKDSLWYMPERYYKVDRPVAPKTILRIIVLDVCDLVCGNVQKDKRCKDAMNQQTSPATRQAQYKWIDSVLGEKKPAGVDRMWTVVMGHWGVYSYAGNADTPELIQSLDPLLKKHRVHAYFSGHDHCMQHIRKRQEGWTRHYFVSGAGGSPAHELISGARSHSDLAHVAMTYGFMSVHLNETLFEIQLIGKNNEVLYTTDIDYE